MNYFLQIPLLLIFLCFCLNCTTPTENPDKTIGMQVGNKTSIKASIYFTGDYGHVTDNNFTIELNDSVIHINQKRQNFDVINLQESTFYTVKIHNENYLDSVSFKTLENQPLTGSLSPKIDSITNDFVTFTFDLPSDPERKEIEYTYFINNKIIEEENISQRVISNSIVNTKITGLERGNKYILKIRASDDQNHFITSPEIKFFSTTPLGFIQYRRIFNRQREAIIYEPKGARSDAGFSSTIFFGGWAHEIDDITSWDHTPTRQEIMDKHKTIYCLPQGVLGGEGEYHWELLTANPESSRDIVFTKEILDYIQRTYNISNRKTHLYGFSAGGGMSCFAGLYFENRIGCIATVQSYYTPFEASPSINEVIPHLNIMATGDNVVEYYNYEPSRIKWFALFNYTTRLETSTYTNNSSKPYTTVEKYKYYDPSTNQLVFQHDKIIGGNHGSPGSSWGATNSSYFMERVCEEFFELHH